MGAPAKQSTEDGEPDNRKKGGGSVSFFWSLLRGVVFLVLLLAIAVLGVSLFATRNAVQTLCQDLVVSSVDRLEARLNAHNEGRGAKYTRSRLPIELVFEEARPDRSPSRTAPAIATESASKVRTGCRPAPASHRPSRR